MEHGLHIQPLPLCELRDDGRVREDDRIDSESFVVEVHQTHRIVELGTNALHHK